MTTGARWWGVWTLLVLAAVPSAHAFDDATAVRVLGFARTQLADTVGELGSTRSPKASRPDGTWTTVSNTDRVGWTQGFFPGSLWLMFQVAHEPLWQRRADRWTRPLEVQKRNRETHDLGFKLMLSHGHAYRLTGDPYYRDVLLTAAESLASRYDSRVGIIDCCDWNPDWKLPLVIDTMVNLELLLWGAANGGRPEWRDMAVSHALKTLADAVRPDGSTYHVVDYEPATGAIRSRGTFQGDSDESTWARGQAWAIYGYTMVYRYTRDSRMLGAARRTADYYLEHLPADMVPNWDFDAPRRQKDSSAAAIVASALLELSALEDVPSRAERYRSAALRTLDSLSSPDYFAAGTDSPGLLLQGVGHLPANREVDVALVYGDYYLLEAVLRFNPRPPYPWYSKTTFSRGLHLLGTGNTGVVDLEFDVTPRRAPIDGVVGYTDSSTSTSSFSSFPLLVRLNTRGYFDARDGASYRALDQVYYRAGRSYHVRLQANLPARCYSVWVRPEGGSEVRIASRFAFRSDAPPMDDVGKVSVRSGQADSEFKVLGHTVSGSSLTGPLLPAAEPGAGEGVAADEGSATEAALSDEEAPSGEEVLPGALSDVGCGSTASGGGPGLLGALALLALLVRRRRGQWGPVREYTGEAPGR